jgi:NADPH:quinone reductase-like Zn-dependent oxidoreductase
MNDWYSEGALAEYCVAPFFALAPKPPQLTYEEAASVPISALTAWQGLFDHAGLQPGERVLIHGGAGSVGVFAIQLARMRGARVIATASARNRDLLMSMGVELFINYRLERFEDRVRDVDIVFDTVGGETLDRSWCILRPGGRMITVASAAEQSTDLRVKQAFFIVEPNQKQLFEIADLLSSGRIRTIVDTVIPLSRAPEAYSPEIRRRGSGKVVVAVTSIQ